LELLDIHVIIERSVVRSSQLGVLWGVPDSEAALALLVVEGYSGFGLVNLGLLDVEGGVAGSLGSGLVLQISVEAVGEEV
jgi:hypothetical protein